MKPLPVGAPLYEYYWLYAAVAPTTGEGCWGELPRLEADCFTVLLHQLSQRYAASLQIVRLEHAPAHVAQRVQSPDHGILRWWPADSPAWNPVERLWEDLKARIDGLDTLVRSSLTALQEHVAGLIRRYTVEAIRSLTGYPYLMEAIAAL